MGKGGKPDGGDGFEEASRDGCEQENMAAWLLGVNTLKIQPFKLPNLGTRDVLVRLKAVGICGSDVHHFKVPPPPPFFSFLGLYIHDRAKAGHIALINQPNSHLHGKFDT
ncbi:hypothetical protein ACE6H2_027510 [Prunus campanulata]